MVRDRLAVFYAVKREGYVARALYFGMVRAARTGMRCRQVTLGVPRPHPGGLTPEQYGDVLAYVLSVNKYPAGDKELAHDTGPLQQITLDEVKP